MSATPNSTTSKHSKAAKTTTTTSRAPIAAGPGSTPGPQHEVPDTTTRGPRSTVVWAELVRGGDDSWDREMILVRVPPGLRGLASPTLQIAVDVTPMDGELVVALNQRGRAELTSYWPKMSGKILGVLVGD